MIRIQRAPEPLKLASIRVERLAAAAVAVASGTKIVFDDYDVVKADLATMQHLKCCYCEKREEQAKYRDVEHYRPKAPYWWLAWTWQNLLFACIDCNREHKRDQFPLSAGDTPLVAPQPPQGGERPLVLDPCDASVDPTREIEFRQIRILGVERWAPHGVTARGWKTIEVCGLDRPNLLDLYRDHVNHVVRPKLRPLFDAHGARDPRRVVEEWNTATRALLAPARPFRALSHDAMLALVRGEIRTEYRLVLDRP